MLISAATRSKQLVLTSVGAAERQWGVLGGGLVVVVVKSVVGEVGKEGLKVSTDRSFKRLRISSLSRKVSEA